MAGFGERFELYLFHRTIACDQACLKGGVDGLVVDFETRGKAERQSGFDTEINTHTMEDLRRVKTELGAYVICRINPPGPLLAREIEDVLHERADEILVPLIRSVDEAEEVVDLIKGRCKVALMVETAEATRIVEQLCRLPIHRLYVGLNDLRISRASPSIFTPLIDGVLENTRSDAGEPKPHGTGGRCQLRRL
jgi:citrate lyase beta subunit